MKKRALTAAVLTFAIGSVSSAIAADATNTDKLETSVIAFDSASGMLQLSNGAVFNQSQIIQSASLQHLYETEGLHELQRKLPTQVRYIAGDTKA